MSRRQHISRYVFHIGKWTIFIGRWVVFANVAFLFILAMSLVAVRLWLPTLVDRKDDIEEFLSRKTDYHFKIEKISTYWDGIYPGIIMQGLSITDKEQQKEELSLQEVRAGIALRPLFRGSLQLGRLSILNPQLALERTSEGTLYLRGLKKGVTPGEKRASVNAYKVLSRLNEVIIENGTLEWNDANDPDGRLVISNVNVVLETSARRYKLNIRAKLPNEMCVSCYVDMEFDPTKLVEKKWSGEVYVHSVGLSPHNLPLIVRERLPENFSGTFDTLLRAEIRDNTPRKIKGYVSLSGLNLQLPGQKKITVDSARGQVDWEYEGNSWSLDTNELEMTLQGQSWNPDKVTVSLGPESSSLQVKQLDLEIAARMLRGVPFEHLLKDKILEINPKGKLSDISLTLQGPLYQPADFSASAVLSDLSLEPIGKIPGVEGLSGKIALTRYSGEFDIDSHAVKVTVPGIFRWPLQARRVLGSVSWHKTDNAWNVDSDKLDLHSDDVDGELNFHFILPHDRAESPYLDLDAVVKNASLQHISRYYPVNKVRPKLLSWLDNGIRGGRVTSGHVVVKGKTREFPFVENNGSFEAVAHIEDGYLDYLPGFPPLTRADILLNFFANKMLITCREGEL
ncbi:MAG: DUF3971 domain-containing protein, partial [Gammaproteobacteria bacterium]|nr:DUF3971 domain-containing protein [Gammaproteobacteria bacterium]